MPGEGRRRIGRFRNLQRHSEKMMTVQDTQAPGTDETNTATTVDTPAAPAAVLDPDDLELQQAEAAAKAEEEATKAKPDNETAAGTAATPPAAAATRDTTDPVMIPKARFDEVNTKLRDKELENARLQGRLEASAPPATTAAMPSQPTAEQRIAAIDSEIDKIAKAFDDGELSMSEFKRQERAFEAQKQVVRDEQLLARVPRSAVTANPDDSLYLHQQTQQVATQHPWVDVFEKVGTDADWDFVRARASDDMKERGFDTSNKAATDLELRQTMARLMDELGPSLVASRAQKAGIALPNGQKPAAPAATPPATKQPLSPIAQARAEKLDLAGRAPPSLDAMTGTAGDGTPSAAAIEAMSEEDIAALPRAVQDKILGQTAA